MRSLIQKTARASRRSLYRLVVATTSVLLATSIFWSAQQHAGAVRFTHRSLFIYSAVASRNTTYTVSFRYPTVNSVGSIRILFCTDPIPSLPCDPPSGLNVSASALSAQTGEVGYTISDQTQNSIILSRPAVTTATIDSSYTFTNVVNPSSPQIFYARLNSFTSTDASGSHIDFGSVASSITDEIGLVTQVPPYLVFCTAKEIPTDCFNPDVGPSFEEFDEPSPEEPLATSSEMLAYTNARGGYVVVLTGRSLTSGIYEIPRIEGSPEVSLPGKGQFGINLTENNEPAIGADPTGPASNIALNPTYTQQDRFVFNPGDVLVSSSGVTLPKKYTVSYIINVPPDQHPGVYSTTVTFICTGNF